MKAERIKSNLPPFSRACSLLRLGCVALFATAALLANPPGHQKLALDGDTTIQGGELFRPKQPYYLNDTGETLFWDTQKICSGYPGAINQVLYEEMNFNNGFQMATSMGLFDEDIYVMNKNGDVCFAGSVKEVLSDTNVFGLFIIRNGGVIKVAESGIDAPGGGKFSAFEYSYQLSSNGRFIVFEAVIQGGAGRGLFLAEIKSDTANIIKSYQIGSPAPGGGFFESFGHNHKVTSNGLLVFDARTTTGYSGLFYSNGDVVGRVAEGDAYNVYANHYNINDNGYLFEHDTQYFISVGTVASRNIIVNQSDTTPNGYEFGAFYNAIFHDSNAVAFTGEYRDWSLGSGPEVWGVYLWTPSGIKTIALKTNLPPGGGLFTSDARDVYVLCVADNKVYFKASTSAGDAIFMGDGDTLVRLIGVGDSLEGESVERLRVDRPNSSVWDEGRERGYNSKGQFIYYAELESRSGLFIYPSSPTVVTPTSTGITTNTANLGGNVILQGGSAITIRGVVYSLASTNPSPAIAGSGVVQHATTGTTGAFTVQVSGLTPSSTYAFRAYATNANGTSYTPAATFSTPPYTLTTTATNGTIQRSPDLPSYAIGTSVTLTAVPASGAVFQGWTGDLSGAANPAVITMDGNKSVSAIFVPSLAGALDTSLAFTLGGNANWIAQTTTTYDGLDAAESGTIGHSQESWMQTTVAGPGQLSFWWRVSSESGYDYLEFYINNVRQTGRISGTSGTWAQQSYALASGTNTLRWRYVKDSSTVSGSDRGWVDQVVYTSAAAQAFNNSMTTAGLTAANALPAATPHNDGVKNLLKYAFNMNLAAADVRGLVPGTGTSGLPSVTSTTSGATTTLRVEFIRRIGSGLVYVPKRSSDLSDSSWITLSDTPTVTPVDANWERVLYEEPLTTATNPTCFGTVEVTLP